MKQSGTTASRSIILVTLAVLVVVLIVSGSLYLQLSGLQGANRSLSSSIASYQGQAGTRSTLSGSSDLVGAWLSHVLKLHDLNTTGALLDYAQNATMIVNGTSQGLGGTYNGVEEISLPLDTLFGKSSNFSFVIYSYSTSITQSSNDTATINAELAFSGMAHVLGAYNGTISASYSYRYYGGGWLISQEVWDFETFNVQFEQGCC